MFLKENCSECNDSLQWITAECVQVLWYTCIHSVYTYTAIHVYTLIGTYSFFYSDTFVSCIPCVLTSDCSILLISSVTTSLINRFTNLHRIMHGSLDMSIFRDCQHKYFSSFECQIFLKIHNFCNYWRTNSSQDSLFWYWEKIFSPLQHTRILVLFRH